MHRILPAAGVDFYKAAGIASSAASTVMAIVAERIVKRPALNAAAPAHAKISRGLGKLLTWLPQIITLTRAFLVLFNTGACV